MPQELTPGQKKILGIKEPAPAVQEKVAPKGMPRQTSDSRALQQVILDLGIDIGTADGKWGPKSSAGLKAAANKYGLFHLTSTRNGAQVSVAPAGLPTLLLGIREIEKGRAIPKTARQVPAWTTTFIVQKLLNVLWYIPESEIDQKFGPKTKAAFTKAASDFGAPLRSARPYANLSVTVSSPATSFLTLFEAWKKGAKRPAPKEPPKAAPKPIKKPAEKPEPATTEYYNRSVIRLQRILRKLGWRARTVATDGKYSKNTADAWASSAKKRGLDPRASRISDTLARVSVATYQAMEAEAAGTKPMPKEPTPTPKPKPKPAGKPGTGYDSKEVNQLLVDLGFDPGGIGAWGNKSRTALKAAAAKHGLKYISSTGYSAMKMVRVNPGTLIPSLQKVLLKRQAAAAKAAADKKKAEAAAKKKRAEEAAARKKADEEKARKAKAAEKAKKQEAKKKAEEAKAEIKKAKKTKKKEDTAKAKKKTDEAKKAIAEAKKAEKQAAATVAAAQSSGSQAAVAQQQAQIAVQEAQVTTTQAQQVISTAQQQAQEIVSQPDVYVTEPEEEEVTMPGEEEEAAPTEPTPAPTKAGMGMGPMLLAGVAVGAVLLIMGKKKGGPRKPQLPPPQTER